jgi:methyl-accepting chemotaxis protein
MIVVISYATVSLRSTAIESAKNRSTTIVSSSANQVHAMFDTIFTQIRTIADNLAVEKLTKDEGDISREKVQERLLNVLNNNPQLVGVGTLWEPGAFDDKDEQYANSKGHDASGRFMVYWNRSGDGTIALETITGFDATDSSNYYGCTVLSGEECIIEPYLYPIQGEEVLMSTFTVPIMAEGEFYGIIAADIRLDTFQKHIDTSFLEQHEGAQLLLISNQGTIVAASGDPDHDLLGKSMETVHSHAKQMDELYNIRQGQRSIHFNNQGDLEVFIPATFGKTTTPWSINVVIPKEEIMADANELVLEMIGIGALMTIIAFGLVWFIARQISTPIRQITETARSVASGNLNVRAPFHRLDEMGLLASVFNQMLESLQQMISEQNNAHQHQQTLQEKIIRVQEASIRELSSPLLPIAEGVVVMPVVGTIDSTRATQITETVLNGISERRATTAIVDITGVSVIDTQVANMLIRMAQMIKLLGAQVVLTGIRADVAQTLIHLGADLSHIITHSTLEDGVAFAIEQSYRSDNSHTYHT